MTLPLPLEKWRAAHWPDDSMRWSGSAEKQLNFLRELERATYFAKDLKNEALRERLRPTVISTHVSKSITLPVVQYSAKSGVTFLVRGNFHDWVVSVRMPCSFAYNLYDLVQGSEGHPHSCCEGFPDEWLYGSMADDPWRFTTGISFSNELFTCMWIITRAAVAQEL